jgi:hypothetical protein
MKTATAVLATIPAQARITRKAAGRGLDQLGFLANISADFTVSQLCQGVFYADFTGRTTGTVAMALRRSTPWQAVQLVAAMLRDGLSLQSQVPAWLNANALAILA